MSTELAPRARRRPGVLRHADRVLARAVFALLAGVYLLVLATSPSSPEAELSFQVTSAFARTGSPRIGGTPEAARLLAGEVDEERDGAQVTTAILEEEHVVWPGEYLLGLPFYVAGRALSAALPGLESAAANASDGEASRTESFAHLAAALRGALFTALTGYFLTLVVRRLGCTRKVAFVTGLAYGLTTFAGPMARGFAVEQQVAFGLIAALHLFLRLQEARGRAIASRIDATAFGLALGLVLVSAPGSWPGVLVLFCAFVIWMQRGLSMRRALRLMAFAGIGVLLAGLALAWPGPARFVRPESTADLPAGIASSPWGALFSPGKGLLFLAPGLVLLALGLPRAWRSRRLFVLGTVITVTLVMALPAVFDSGWPGGWSFGPAPLLPALPFLWIGVAFGIQAAAERHLGAKLVALLFAFGLFVQLGGWFVDVRTYRELSLAASPIVCPDLEGTPEIARERALTRRLPSIVGFAAPLVHWRVLRHRVAGLGEEFPLSEIFLVDEGGRVEALEYRERGFHHLAWLNLHEGSGGLTWPVLLLALCLFAAGGLTAARALDPTAP